MTTISVAVCDACQAPVSGSTVVVGVVVNPAHPPVTVWSGGSPARFAAPAGSFSIGVTARAAGYYDANVVLQYDGRDWRVKSGAASITVSQDVVSIAVGVGRLRFAPASAASGTSQITRSPYNPGGVLLDGQNYRTVWYAPATFRTLKSPAVANVDGAGWDRFHFAENNVPMASYGVWLDLEYGDPEGSGSGVRQLVGVWAPFRVAAVPSVLVQLTPNTSDPSRYPADALPFSGLYPFGCHSGQQIPAPLSTFRQEYAELPANRTLTGWAIAYQVYAARTDLFGAGQGPIVITPSPAFLGDHVLREPLNSREGIGRLIAEVLWFLWSAGITSAAGTGGGSLAFSDGQTSFTPREGSLRPAESVPSTTTTTVVTHSAGVAALYQLATLATWDDMVAQPQMSGQSLAKWLKRKALSEWFPRALYGGTTKYGDANWHGMWVIDGIEQPGGFSPSPGSPAARAWRAWQAEDSDHRSIAAVYTESGLGESRQNGLISGVTRRYGRAGWVEEKRDGLIAWLRFSNSFLITAHDPASAAFKPHLEGVDPHNFIYSLGVGYAAQAFA